MTIRETTKEQFTAGTTVDGSRLDRALDDTVAAYSELQPRHRRRRHYLRQVVGGYSPMKHDASGTTRRAPYLPHYNEEGYVTDGPVNPFRNKGYFRDHLTLVSANLETQFIVTKSIAIAEPATLVGVCITMLNDTDEYKNTFQWDAGATRPPGVGAGDWVDDFHLDVLVDDPHAARQRERAAVAVIAARHQIGRHRISVGALPAPGGGLNDMQPAHPSLEAVSGVEVLVEGINVPLPANSGVRLSWAVPQYDLTTPYASPWETDLTDTWQPWQGQVLTWEIALLEG